MAVCGWLTEGTLDPRLLPAAWHIRARAVATFRVGKGDIESGEGKPTH